MTDKSPIIVITLCITMLVLANCGPSTATEPASADVPETKVPMNYDATPLTITISQPQAIQTPPSSRIAVESAEQVQSEEQPLPTPGPTITPQTRFVLVPTRSAAGNNLLSPLPTPGPMPEVELTALLSETVDVQSRMTISMALMARSLIQIMQQPVYPPPVIDTAAPVVIADTIITHTTPPPLPTGQIGGVTLPPRSVAMPVAAQPANPLLLQFDGELRTARVPILMYHYLSVPPADADIYRRDLSVAPTLFAEHLDRILADGYTVISLYDLITYLTQGTPLPPKPVVITFDDGYRDNYENAFPLLRDRNLAATFFVVMEFINQARPEYLTWEMVSEMAAGGMLFEVHGVDHTTLRGRNEADLGFQALRSYETLQNLLAVRPRFLSYPAGEYDQQTIDVFRNAGYWAGLTTIQGATHRSDALFELRRVRVRGTTTPDELARLLALDW